MWNHIHFSHRTGKWQPCPLQLQHLLFPFLQLPLSPNSIAVSFTSSPSTALPFTNNTYFFFSSPLLNSFNSKALHPPHMFVLDQG